MCLLFLDWKMAFDKVDHRSLELALQRSGVNRHDVETIEDLYQDQSQYLDLTGKIARLNRTPASGRDAL